jgi:hypothetical protein
MNVRPLLLFIFFLINYLPPGFAQTAESGPEQVISEHDSLIFRVLVQDDTLPRPEIVLSRDQAVDILQRTFRLKSTINKQDSIQSAISQLVFSATNSPIDSVKNFLNEYIYKFEKKSVGDSAVGNPVLLAETGDTLITTDTSSIAIINDKIIDKNIDISLDTLKAAIGVLVEYIEERDSSVINFTGFNGKDYEVWLNSRSNRMIRFWLKNELDDSVTVWIGNPSRNTIGLYLEQGVTFLRPTRQGNISEARIELEPPDNSRLVNVQKIITKAQFWRLRTEASFALNQGAVSNWVKGGENNVSTSFDITWFADYNNKSLLLSSSNFARIKYGLIKSGEDGIRKNLDLLETNSKVNHKAFGKFDFSGIMLFKTQISKGYNYPNDSIPVSKLNNPAIITLGFGLDYKPNKLTSINFSPLSYKATFVPDTAVIDQTKYGVASNKRSKHEPGASFMFTNELRPAKNMVVTNRLQLFTNYINNPLNIDVDWEMIFQANLNWFTDVRLNTHLIFDDDTKTPVFDKENKPVMGNDGVQKKTARIQFKELLGLSFIFRF